MSDEKTDEVEFLKEFEKPFYIEVKIVGVGSVTNLDTVRKLMDEFKRIGFEPKDNMIQSEPVEGANWTFMHRHQGIKYEGK